LHSERKILTYRGGKGKVSSLISSKEKRGKEDVLSSIEKEESPKRIGDHLFKKEKKGGGEKGYSIEEIYNLHLYRERGKKVNRGTPSLIRQKGEKKKNTPEKREEEKERPSKEGKRKKWEERLSLFERRKGGGRDRQNKRKSWPAFSLTPGGGRKRKEFLILKEKKKEPQGKEIPHRVFL